MVLIEKRVLYSLVDHAIGVPVGIERTDLIDQINRDFIYAQEAIDNRDEADLREHIKYIIHAVARFDRTVYWEPLIEAEFPEFLELRPLPDNLANDYRHQFPHLYAVNH